MLCVVRSGLGASWSVSGRQGSREVTFSRVWKELFKLAGQCVGVGERGGHGERCSGQWEQQEWRQKQLCVAGGWRGTVGRMKRWAGAELGDHGSPVPKFLLVLERQTVQWEGTDARAQKVNRRGSTRGWREAR